ncbi:MAG: MraY family glycosyltransferase [Sphingobacteriia bacterium]
MILISLFLLTLAFSYVLNAVLINYAGRLGQLSQGVTTQVRWASTSKPLVGGIAFFILFLIGAVVYTLIPHTAAYEASENYLPFLLAVTLGFLVGLADDAYTTRPLLKFIGQLGCGFILLGFGIQIHLFNHALADGMLTMLWVVGLMNSINMLDNMDGVTGSTSLVIVFFTLMAMYLTGQTSNVFFYLFVGIAGSLAGFLILNWHPSKLYMGDTGSQFLGAILAYAGIVYFWNIHQVVPAAAGVPQVVLPLLVFLMPILDTAFVSVARLRRGQSPFVGGRDHTTHHLCHFGVPQAWVPLVFGLAGSIGGGAALLMIWAILFNITDALMLLSVPITVFGIFLYIYQRGLAKSKVRQMKAHAPIVSLGKDEPRQAALAVSAR